jgi:hypothetical protein
LTGESIFTREDVPKQAKKEKRLKRRDENNGDSEQVIGREAHQLSSYQTSVFCARVNAAVISLLFVSILATNKKVFITVL